MDFPQRRRQDGKKGPAPNDSYRGARFKTLQHDIRLLLADVDGTLLTQEKVLTEEAKEASGQLRRAGVRLAITSGRPPRGMKMLIKPLALDTVIAGFNGGLLVNPDFSVVSSFTLDPAAAKQTLTLMIDQGLDAWIYTGNEWLIRNANAPHVAREAWTVKFDPETVERFSDAQLSEAVKIVGVSDDFELVAACAKAVQNTLGPKANAACSQPYYLDVTHPQANKGMVVQTLSNLLSIPLEQIATIGDMPTDIPMFCKSGFSIAMANANDEVKARADVVTDSNENDGFAKAVHELLLRLDDLRSHYAAHTRTSHQTNSCHGEKSAERKQT